VNGLDDVTIDQLVRSSAVTTDVELTPLVDSSAARTLFEGIVSTPYPSAVRDRLVAYAPSTRRVPARRRRLVIALVAAVAVVILAVPAAGVVRSVASWLTGGHGPDFPVPTGDDIVLASGISGVPWRIVASSTDQGLCVFVVHGSKEGTAGSGGCGWSSQPFGPGNGEGGLHKVTFDNWSGWDSAFDPDVIGWGFATKDVASVDLVLTYGGTTHADVIDTPTGLDGPPRFFWAAVPCPPSVTCGDGPGLVREIIARDAAGNVLEGRDVTGSPKDESAPPG
jgi:hypothetical protein